MYQEKYMKRALVLAKKATPSPNPKVGCVIVKNNKIIGEGYHLKAGMPHAEIVALDGINASGAEMYVTLEPCSHYGKTPPCTDAIVRSGIKKVYVAVCDQNPIICGLEELQKHGVPVEYGFLEEDARKMNEAFFTYISKNRPFVIVKVAMSLDGKIATKTGQSKWITNEKSRKFVHQLRSEVDAVCVGAETVKKDDPSLTVKMVKGKNPIRIVVDSKFNLPLNSKIFNNDAKTIIVTSENIPQRKIGSLEIIHCREQNGKIILSDMLSKLAEKEITSILVEGGGSIIGSFFDEKLVDKAYLFFAPIIIGGRDAKTGVEGSGISELSEAIKLKDVKTKRIGDDILVEGYIE